VVEPFDAEIGIVEPYFGYPSGGMQVKLPQSVDEMIRAGYLREVK
jgi:hypothetical protein